jgi:3-oxoacyl-[acyl-carrier-protein] synthase III
VASSTIDGVKLVGIASAVPRTARTAADEAPLLGAEQASKISTSVGIVTRRVVSGPMCTSDLCYAAAGKLLQELNWNREEIGGLIFISQTPDYVLPPTSCSLHRRLGLASSCFAFDVNLGCSGYVYGLWLAGSLVKTTNSKVLLLVGDTISRVASPQDGATVLLFGDAGSATALEPSGTARPFYFHLGSDGSGENSLIVPAGGFRQPRSDATGVRTVREGGNIRSDEDLFMDGPSIFMFTLQRVPHLVETVLQHSSRTADDVDFFVFHQANRFMLDHLAKRMKIPPARFVVALRDFGNTSSASIPLAITTTLRDRLRTSPASTLLAGFGVGFSWAAAMLDCGPMVIPELVECQEELLSAPAAEPCMS